MVSYNTSRVIISSLNVPWLIEDSETVISRSTKLKELKEKKRRERESAPKAKYQPTHRNKLTLTHHTHHTHWQKTKVAAVATATWDNPTLCCGHRNRTPACNQAPPLLYLAPTSPLTPKPAITTLGPIVHSLLQSNPILLMFDFFITPRPLT